MTANADARDSSVSWLPSWQQCDESTVMKQYRLDKLLQAVDVPWYLLSDLQANCDVSVIDKYCRTWKGGSRRVRDSGRLPRTRLFATTHRQHRYIIGYR